MPALKDNVPVKVGWWPQVARAAPLGGEAAGFAAELVFPSGRAAIAQSLDAIDLPTNSPIGVPTLSSDCLRRVVSRFGIPVDVCRLDRRILAAVVYEQWGWPLPETAWQELTDRFDGRLLLVDRVDSADFFVKRRELHDRPGPGTSVEVLSLSKLLGIPGGGLARTHSAYQAFVPQPESPGMARLRARPPADLERSGYAELFKESRQSTHPAVLAWLGQNCLASAAEAERTVRQRNSAALLSTGLSDGWPSWMLRALADGAGPVWAPVLRGQDASRRWNAMRSLDRRLGVISASRPFNWSGNPLRPEFEMSLAVPVHGHIAEFDAVIAAIA